MNPEKSQHHSPETPETAKEKEKFEPFIIFDFIRHGQAEYGELLKQKIKELGYTWEDLLPTSRIATEQVASPADLEGRITSEGKEQLEDAAKILIEKIDKDNESVMLLFGPRFRTIDSSKIILKGLEEAGIDVRKAREHKDLIDMKKHWLAILEFVKNKAPNSKKGFSYWLNMSEQEIHEADLESVRDIGRRMDHFVELIKRYTRRYEEQLGLENKKIRVIAITHDTNIMSVLEKEGISSQDAQIIKNAQIIELGINKQGKSKLLF